MQEKEVVQLVPSDESVPLVHDSYQEGSREGEIDTFDSAHWVGYLLAFLSSGFFALNVVCIKTATFQGRLSSPEVVYSASTIMSSIAVITIGLNRSARQSLIVLTWRRIAVAILRGLIGTINILLFYKAIELLPAGQADASYFVTPALTIFVAAVCLREKVQLADCLLAAGSILGVLLISSPALISNDVARSSHILQYILEPHQLVGVCCALLAAFFNACGMVLTRSLSKRVHYLHLVFILGACGVFLTTISGNAVSVVAVRERCSTAIFAILASGVMVTTAQILIHASLNIIPAGRASLVRNCEVPLVYITAICFLGERLSALPLLGSVIVVTSAAVIGLRHIFRNQS